MNTEQVSSLYMISFSHPRIHPNRHGDFCVYFALETQEAGTLDHRPCRVHPRCRTEADQVVSFWVLQPPRTWEYTNTMHPSLHDLAYSWDGVATAYGVLQFSAPPVAVMNIQRVFHRTASICAPFSHTRRYEYFATGMFLDMERKTIPSVFNGVESAAQYVRRAQFRPTFRLLIRDFSPGSCAMTATSLLTPRITSSTSRSK
jgi:hypothetical protein